MRCLSTLWLCLTLAACGGGGGSLASETKPPAKLHLVIRVQPANVQAGRRMRAVEVAVVDASGKTAVASEPQVEVGLVNAGPAVLAGTLEVTAARGVARFTDLSVDRPARAAHLVVSAAGFKTIESAAFDVETIARHVVVLIADGWGYRQLDATARYTRKPPVYAAWQRVAMTTWDLNTKQANQGVGYDPDKAWQSLDYLRRAATDSASAATAMFTGLKTDQGNISVGTKDVNRLVSLSETATRAGLGSGAVSSVPLSHATPGAWFAHNDNRVNGYAIADEGLFGDPNTTGSLGDPNYGGHHGPTRPSPDVMLGAGHPDWSLSVYLNQAIVKTLRTGSGKSGFWTFVERLKGRNDAGQRLMAAARNTTTERLVGLFGGAGSNLDFRLADGSGKSPEDPTLAEMTRAALTVLARKPKGFILMVEGGAVDWAGHGNNLDMLIGEMIGFNEAVRAVVDWVEDASNAADWNNTLVIVTGDHECGALTRRPEDYPNTPLGAVDARTLALERPRKSNGRRASWEDDDKDGDIDPNEKVYWTWNSGGHTNALVPVYAKGRASAALATGFAGIDPVWGRYIDNTRIHAVISSAIR